MNTSCDASIQRVLVTRPAHQQTALLAAIRSLGLEPISLPTLAIESRPFTLDLLSLAQADRVLFTSANAVEQAHESYPLPWQDVDVVAIGEATARALKRRAQTQIDPPPEPNNSEGFIRRLQNDWLDQGKPLHRLVIITGEGGRRTLQDWLQQHRIDCQLIETYRRVPVRYAEDTLSQLLDPAPPDLIQVSSDEVLDNLVTLIGPERLQRFSTLPMIVNSARCGERARGYGFNGEIHVATPPGDDGQLTILRSLKAMQRG